MNTSKSPGDRGLEETHQLSTFSGRGGTQERLPRRRTIRATNIPLNSPLQQQIDEFIAEGRRWVPPDLLRVLLRPVGQLGTSGAAANALREGQQRPDFSQADQGCNA